MATVAAAGAAQLALAVLAVLNRIALVVGWTGLLCLAVVFVRIACAGRGDMRLARQRKRFPKPSAPQVGDDTIAMLKRRTPTVPVPVSNAVLDAIAERRRYDDDTFVGHGLADALNRMLKEDGRG